MTSFRQRLFRLGIGFTSLLALGGCRQTASWLTQSSTELNAIPASSAPTQPVSQESTRQQGPQVPAQFAELASLQPQPQPAPQQPAAAVPPEAAAPNPAPAAEGPLQLADLEQLAVNNHPGLGEAVARLDAARGEWLQVGLRPNPTIGYSGQQLGSGGQAEQQGAFLGQVFITGKKLQLSRESAAWRVQRAEYEVESMRMRVLTDVRVAFYEVLIAQQRRALAQELVQTSEQAVKAAEALFQGEEVSEADPLRARLAADAAGIILNNAVNQHLAAWRRLVALIGTGPMPLREVQGDLNAAQWQFNWQAELDRLINESPQLAAALADVEAARWAIERAYAEVVPDIDVQTVLQDDRGTGQTNANLQITLPLPLWNRNQGGIRRAFGDAMAAEQAMQRVQLDLQSRLAAAFQRYQSASNQVHEYSKPGGILDKSRRTLDLLRSGYQAEEFGILDLLTAQRTFFETNLAYLDALQELTTSAMEIRGLLLRGSLQQ